MRVVRGLRLPAFTTVFVLAGCATLGATTLRRMSLDELTSVSQTIARVRCMESESRLAGGQIWTWTRFEVIELLKGQAPAQITVRLIGGRAGRITATVDGVPRFRQGENVILFLEMTRAGDWTIVSWVQGTFRVRLETPSGAESVSQDSSGLAIFDPATRQFLPGGVRRLPLAEFRSRVRDAIERSVRGRR